jgi:hypothetical protein
MCSIDRAILPVRQQAGDESGAKNYFLDPLLRCITVFLICLRFDF